ncbi:MAG: hypothetical protein Q8L68_01405 [Methylococcales bacterium]|nr:hypothetical protein [Methylococcales bacterium]
MHDKREVHFSGKIYFIGDSHKECFLNMPNIIARSVYPVRFEVKYPSHCMYTVGRDNAKGIYAAFDINEIQDGDALFFTFGWVDANLLIWKQVEIKNRTLEEVIEVLVNEYLNAISRFTDKKTIKIIYNIPPPYHRSEKEIPVVERILYTKKINETLAKECAARQMDFLYIYDNYCDTIGALLPEKSDGEHHIHEAHHPFIFEELWKILLKYM